MEANNEKLLALYAQYNENFDKISFDKYKNTLYKVANNIYNAYILRYCCNEYISVVEDEAKVMKQLHAGNNDISLDKILTTLINQDSIDLNYIVKIKACGE